MPTSWPTTAWAATGSSVVHRALTPLQVDFLDYCEANGSTPNTIKTYRSALRQMAALTRIHVEHFGPRECDAIFHAPWAARTRRTRISALRQFHSWLRDHDYPFSPAALVASQPKEPKQTPNPFTADEIARLRRIANVVEQPDWQSYFFILDATGCRAMDPLKLDGRNLDGFWGRRKRDIKPWIRFPDTKVGPFHCPVWDIAAAGRPAARKLRAKLNHYWNTAKNLSLDRPFFASLNGIRHTQKWVEPRWQEHCALAGVEGTLSQLRHTFACEELERTRDIARVKMWMNHATIDTTLIYADYISMRRPETPRRHA